MLPTDDLFFALAPQPVLEKQIGECIISPEEMADTASVTLRDLRRKIRATEDSIRTKLDAIIKNSTTNKFLQDAVVSIRNGRYVVPVRAEYRGEVGGVIHDVSSTGSTVFVEPTAVVEANARIMQLHAQEQEEITRILTGRSLARWHRLSRSSATAMTLCCKLTCCWPKPALRWSRTPLCRR